MKLVSVAVGFCTLGLLACSSEPGPLPGGAGGVPSNPAGGVPGAAGSQQPGAGGAGGSSLSTSGAGGGIIPGAGGNVPGAGGNVPGAGGNVPGAGGNVPGAGGNVSGAGGTGGGGSGNTGGNSNTGKSAGCGRTEPLAEQPQSYVRHDMIVDVAPEYKTPKDYSTREYHTWLPNDYDPNRAYPLFFWGNGCGVQLGKPEGIPVANIPEVQSGAILVFMIQEDGCFDAGKGGVANTPDVPYFEKMLNEIEANYCVDQGKVFAGGYSSGAWFAATLSCSHGNRLNAIGMAAGGQQDVLPMCTGPAGLLLWAGNETGNPIDAPPNEPWKGSGAVRDRLIAENGCANTTTKWNTTNAAWSSCNLYDNCGKNPVVFCPHGGGHDNGTGSKISSDGMWALFKSTW